MFRSGAIKRRSKKGAAARRAPRRAVGGAARPECHGHFAEFDQRTDLQHRAVEWRRKPIRREHGPARFSMWWTAQAGRRTRGKLQQLVSPARDGNDHFDHPGSNDSSTATPKTFFTSSVGGLATTPVILKAGFVVEGNVPADSNSPSGVGQGEIQIINRYGKVVLTLSNSTYLPDPWYITANDLGPFVQLFVLE